MPLIFQTHILRFDLQANPRALYLFGDNDLRRGMAGQAGEMRGEPNALGIRTKRAPTMAAEAFLSDADYETRVAMWRQDLAPAFAHVREGGVVVCPLKGPGTGLAGLDIRAPQLFAALRGLIKDLRREEEQRWPKAS